MKSSFRQPLFWSPKDRASSLHFLDGGCMPGCASQRPTSHDLYLHRKPSQAASKSRPSVSAGRGRPAARVERRKQGHLISERELEPPTPMPRRFPLSVSIARARQPVRHRFAISAAWFEEQSKEIKPAPERSSCASSRTTRSNGTTASIRASRRCRFGVGSSSKAAPSGGTRRRVRL
jgi:hypothetical protein